MQLDTITLFDTVHRSDKDERNPRLNLAAAVRCKRSNIMSDLINEYISLAIEHGETTLSGDYKKGNKAHAKMMKTINKIKDSSLEIRKQFFGLMYHENDSVKVWTAVTLLKTCENEALTVLKNIEKLDKDIFALDAKMTIDSWEKGLLTNLTDWNKTVEKNILK